MTRLGLWMVGKDSKQPPVPSLPVLWIRLSPEALTAGISPGCPIQGPFGVCRDTAAQRCSKEHRTPRLGRNQTPNASAPGWGGELCSGAVGEQHPVRPAEPREGQASAQAPRISSPWWWSEERDCDGWEGNLLRGGKKKPKRKQQLLCHRAWQLC